MHYPNEVRGVDSLIGVWRGQRLDTDAPHPSCNNLQGLVNGLKMEWHIISFALLSASTTGITNIVEIALSLSLSLRDSSRCEDKHFLRSKRGPWKMTAVEVWLSPSYVQRKDDLKLKRPLLQPCGFILYHLPSELTLYISIKRERRNVKEVLFDDGFLYCVNPARSLAVIAYVYITHSDPPGIPYDSVTLL